MRSDRTILHLNLQSLSSKNAVSLDRRFIIAHLLELFSMPIATHQNYVAIVVEV